MSDAPSKLRQWMDARMMSAAHRLDCLNHLQAGGFISDNATDADSVADTDADRAIKELTWYSLTLKAND